MAVFDGSVKSVFRDRKELSGSLLEQLEKAYAYIDSFNRTRSEFEGLDRIDKRDYPPADMREEILIGLFENSDTISRKDVEVALKVSQATAISVLRKMVEKSPHITWLYHYEKKAHEIRSNCSIRELFIFIKQRRFYV